MDDSASTYTQAADAAIETGDPAGDTDAALSRVQNALLSFLRHLLTFIPGLVVVMVGKGLMPASLSEMITGLLNNAGLAIATVVSIVASRLLLTFAARYVPGIYALLGRAKPGGLGLFLAAGCWLALPSCSQLQTSGITGTLSYENGKPAVSITVPIHDSAGKSASVTITPVVTATPPAPVESTSGK